MIDVPQKKEKIVSFLESNGPSLPVRIAKEIEMSPVFASAILAELLQAKKVRLSNLKIGSSPLYLLPDQESMLEGFIDNLKGVEKEAVLLLREKGRLNDESQDPAIRVALRGAKDFAKPVDEGGRIRWEYVFSKPQEKKEPKQEKSVEPQKSAKESKPQAKQVVQNKKVEQIFEKQEATETSDSFEEEIISFIASKKFEFVEKIQSDKKELVAKVNLPTAVGNINFLLIAKNKRTTTKDEINSAIQRAEYEKMPCLYIITKDPPKNLKSFAQEYQNLLKILVLEK